MAEKPGKSEVKLDREGLRSFIENEVKPFLDEIRKMNQPSSFAPSMAQILGKEDYDNKDWFGMETPLAIGKMGSKDAGGFGDVHGQQLNDQITESGNSFLEILRTHEELFGDIVDGLESTIKELFKTRDGGLEKIEGQKFLDYFTDVDQILQETGSAGKDAKH
ncbi:type VII secretion system-associated protein [Streptomyces sp. NPDC001177]